MFLLLQKRELCDPAGTQTHRRSGIIMAWSLYMPSTRNGPVCDAADTGGWTKPSGSAPDSITVTRYVVD